MYFFFFFQENVILGSDYPFPLGEHHPGKLIEDVYKDDLELRVREQPHSVSRFLFAIDKTPPSSLLWNLVAVEPRLRSLKRGVVISRFFSIHYTVTGAENIFQYTEDSVISSFVISRFHCTKEKEK